MHFQNINPVFRQNVLKAITIFLSLFSVFTLAYFLCSKVKHGEKQHEKKLLILLLDGFRWDYYDMHKKHMPAFTKFIEEGVRVEYVEPIFPSASIPSWTTIVTGLYAAYHNMLGNYMFERATEDSPEMVFNFENNSSMKEIWWQSAEPLWITATKQGHKVYLADFSRCDVPFHGILPTECTGYKDWDLTYNYREKLNIMVQRFRQGFTLGMVYYPWLDMMGHRNSPESEKMLKYIIEADLALEELMQSFKLYGLLDKVNVVITSDHGMTDVSISSGTEYVMLEDYIGDLENVYKVVGSESSTMIATMEGKTEEVYKSLQAMPGVYVYKKSDIPDELHIKESRNMHDILIVAKPKYCILGLNSSKQLPEPYEDSLEKRPIHTHGYYNLADMRSIFFARGPAFKKGLKHPPIRLVDQYQIFTYLLGLQPCKHNGTWNNVVNMISSITYFM